MLKSDSVFYRFAVQSFARNHMLLTYPDNLVIADVIEHFNHSIFIDAKCLLGGGYGIRLLQGDYRNISKIEFFCDSSDGYQTIRDAIAEFGPESVAHPRHVFNNIAKFDQLSIKFTLKAGHLLIPVAIWLETRLQLQEHSSVVCPVKVMSPQSLFAERLLALADSNHDFQTTVLMMVDLASMINYWGDVFSDSFLMADHAYGEQAMNSYRTGAALLLQPNSVTEAPSSIGNSAISRESLHVALSKYL